MTHALDDLARHNTWATASMIRFCMDIDREILDTPVPGTYGSVMATLRHMIDSEMSYLFRLTSAWGKHPWQAGEPVNLDMLLERTGILGDAFAAYLATGLDLERRGEARGDRGEVFSVPAGVFITQIFHHANLHRSHVCTQLSVQGIQPPDFSAWDYAIETGRSTLDRSEPRSIAE